MSLRASVRTQVEKKRVPVTDLVLGGEDTNLGTWRRVFAGPLKVELTSGARLSIERAAEFVGRIVARGEPIYGINTGFGTLSDRCISGDRLSELQRNLVLETTVGVGEPLPDEVVRLALALKIATIAKGHSGVKIAVVDALLRLLCEEALPVVPSQGSVGASGDLAPLAHMVAPLLGFGRVRYRGEELQAGEALGRLGMSPLTLAPKEGLALLNGTQVSTALAMAGLFGTERLFRSAIVTGAIATEAVLGSLEAFDERLHSLRRQPGQMIVAAASRALLQSSGFCKRAELSGRRQDPYCIRCQPQVMGAALDLLNFVAGTLAREGNAVTDNPVLLVESERVVSGGNFHAEPVAFAADILALVLVEIASMAERRIALMVDGTLSGLPPFLTSEPGVSSGFMSAQIAAAALVAETRQRAHPASIDSIPTVANLEDHVSMATHAAKRLLDMISNVTAVLATELLAAVEGCEYRALQHGPRLGKLHTLVRARIQSLNRDRWFEPALAAARELIANGSVAEILKESELPTP